MTHRRFSLRAASGLSIFLAVAVFALMSLLTVVLGAGVYRGVVERADANHEVRTAIAYVTGKVRGATGEITIEKTEVGNDMLVITEQYGERYYQTRIYAHEGNLYEVFAAQDTAFAPEEGQKIVSLDGFEAAREGELLRLKVHSGGGEYTSSVSLSE